MKQFNQEHEAIIEFWHKPEKVIPPAKEGDIIPHRKTVERVYFYQRETIDEESVYRKIELTAKMIIELADEIRELQKQTVDMPYDELPF